MGTSIKFLLQATKILSDVNYTDQDLDKIYTFLISIDNEELFVYYNSNTVISYSNDLELYIESVIKLIKILEGKERYEQCHELNKKQDESIMINKK